MNSDQQTSWRRRIVFDPMNAHSQADDPTLTYVMQFNADERKSQEKFFQKLASLEELLREAPAAAASGVPQIAIGTGITSVTAGALPGRNGSHREATERVIKLVRNLRKRIQTMSRRKVTTHSVAVPEALLGEIRALIESARQRTVAAVNSELTLLFWRVGRRIQTEMLAGGRAGYGEEIVPTLAAQLVRDYGRGFAEKNLRRMMQFATTFPDEPIVVTLSRQLSWSHFVALLPLKERLQREYYAQMCCAECWSVRTLRGRIDSMLYERTVLSRQPDALIEQELATMQDAQRMSPNLVMRDPYILDFLGLRDTWQESDLEAAIIREMESFLLELGVGFTFVARQKRIQLDADDFYLDLLFYNRKLHRLVAAELKVGEFKPAYKGQMELYLRWLDKFEREPEEASPLGIILCTGKKSEQIELLELDKSGIHVAEYLTTLPPRAVLIERLEQATRRAQLQIGQRAEGE